MDLHKSVGSVEDKWKLLPAYLKSKGLVKQHIDSFDYFVKHEMKQIIRAPSNRVIRSEVERTFFIEFLDVRLGTPHIEANCVTQSLTPMMCRHRDITYNAPVLVDIEFLRGNSIVRRRNVEIGRLPVMLKSCACVLHGKSDERLRRLGECTKDPGGYFVVKGTEKVILMQEQLSKNRIIVEKDAKGFFIASVTSASAESKSRTLVVYRNNKLYLRHNSFSDDVPFVVALKAMGVISDQEIFQLIGWDEAYTHALVLSIEDCITEEIFTQKAALVFLGKKMRPRFFKAQKAATKAEDTNLDESMDFLHRILLSHIPDTAGNQMAPKVRFLALMARRAIDASVDPTHLDDKDYYGNKRLELAGQMVSLLFEDLFKRFCTQTQKMADQMLTKWVQSSKNDPSQYPDCCRNLSTDILTKGFQTALSTGNWNIKRFKIERSGVSQVLNRLSYIATLGMMTRLNSNVDKGLKCAGPRWLQPSQWGLLCPCDTPEGEACGLVKNLSLMTHVTNDEDDTPLVRIAYALGVEAATAISGEELHDPGTCIVFLNGLVLGVHRGPAYLMRSFRRLRRMSKIGQFVSIFENPLHRAIYIASDGGRLSRPLIIVEDGQSRLTNQHMQKLAESEIDFMDLLRTAVLEWIDVNEENSCLIAIREENITPDTTHLEIDPLTMMGVVAGLIPYPNHNQSPRNTYQCAMGKQAMGAIAYNQFNRTDSVMYLLVYPQRPLVQTRTLEFIKWWELPAGHNCSVAVMSYSGYDIEDAICMNRGSIDRGFGRCYVLKRQSTELKRYPNGAQDMVLPPPDGTGQGKSKSRAVNTRFACLDDDGVGRVGALVSEDQVYINKHVPVITKDALVDQRSVDSSYRPDTVRYKAPVPAFIDKIVVAENHEGNRVYKCCFRQVRKPEYGDKFSSRHGQKGVVGFIVEPEDMPFTESGWTPDLIMNPHGFPSRMTIGKMLELLGGKSALLDGKVKYGTAFGGTPLHEIEGILTANGFHYSGKEYLTSGITGQALQTYIFTGPIYYQKLKHMVQDKIHARGRGPRQMLTRQPTEGRAKMGGLRLGEMERDCLVAYGAANLLIERLMLSSDAFKAYVCATCGLLVSPNWCQFCKSESNVTVIQLPYACKLLFQEMLSMNVACRLRLKET